MINKLQILIFISLLLLGYRGTSQEKKLTKPNIVFILADDLGYGDVGAFFQNERAGKKGMPAIRTPFLDSLATQGAMLTNHYCGAPVCAPSRASLFSGKNQGHANVRNNQFDKAIENNYTLGTILQKNGYKTALVGKWGLQGEGQGPDWPAHPLKRGFDYYLGYIRHKDGHEHYPKEGLYDGKKELYEGKVDISDSLDNVYTGDLFTAVSKKWIVNQNKENPQQPFFLFLSFDTPHAVLELPAGEYPHGSGLHGGLSWLGKNGKMINTASGKPDSYVDPSYENATYDDDGNPNTKEVPWPDTYKRYATVVTRIDHQVGDLVQLLKDLNLFENTMIVFTSDNGPSKESYLPKQYVGYNPEFFQSFGPFEGIKRDVWEGGMREPTIVTWPKEIKSNTVVEEPSNFYDWIATFSEVVSQPKPAGTNGHSILPELKGKYSGDVRTIYTEYYHKRPTPNYKSFSEEKRGKPRGEMQMLRIGDTLGIRYNVTASDSDFEFFDIPKDPSQRHPLNLKNMEDYQERWKKTTAEMRFQNESAKRPYDDFVIPSQEKPKSDMLKWEFYAGDFPWVADIKDRQPSKTGETQNFEKLPSLEKGEFQISESIYIQQTGRYEFQFNTEDPAVLRMYEINLIDSDFNHSAKKTYKNSIVLEKGYHPITIFYKNSAKGKPKISLSWKKV